MPSTSPALAKARERPNVPAPSMEFTREITVDIAVAPDLLMEDERLSEDSEQVLEFVCSGGAEKKSSAMRSV